jgi:aldehyde:ferredoxin oxidoreductase
MFVPWSVEHTVGLVRAITGWKTHAFELQLAAQRGITLARIFNLREGLTRADDRLPPRLSEPFRTPSSFEKPVDPAAFEEALSLYYGMMGWDPQTGAPGLAKLHELDIAWAAAHLPV